MKRPFPDGSGLFCGRVKGGCLFVPYNEKKKPPVCLPVYIPLRRFQFNGMFQVRQKIWEMFPFLELTGQPMYCIIWKRTSCFHTQSPNMAGFPTPMKRSIHCPGRIFVPPAFRMGLSVQRGVGRILLLYKSPCSGRVYDLFDHPCTDNI